MSNNTGYIRTENLYRIENLDLIGTLTGAGSQICINRTNDGPVLQIGGNPSYNNDLFLIQSPTGEDIFRVDNNGKIWIEGGLLNYTIPASQDGILFAHDEDLKTDPDNFVWDHTLSRLGVGTDAPQDRIHLKDGNFHIQNGSIIFDNNVALTKNMCVLDATNGDANDNQGLILGDPSTNGSWRVVVTAAGSLVVQKRIGGAWQTRGQFS